MIRNDRKRNKFADGVQLNLCLIKQLTECVWLGDGKSNFLNYKRCQQCLSSAHSQFIKHFKWTEMNSIRGLAHNTCYSKLKSIPSLSACVCVNCGKKIVLFLQINPKITFKWSIDRIASPAEIDRWFFVSSLKWILVEKRLHVPMAFIWNISSHPKCLESLDSGIFCVISGAIDVARHV